MLWCGYAGSSFEVKTETDSEDVMEYPLSISLNTSQVRTSTWSCEAICLQWMSKVLLYSKWIDTSSPSTLRLETVLLLFIKLPVYCTAIYVCYTENWQCVIDGGGFKEWPLVQWPTRPLPYGPRRPWWKSIKNCITAAKTGFLLLILLFYFYSFKLCTVDKVHAVRPVDNNNDMLFPSQKFNSLFHSLDSLAS